MNILKLLQKFLGLTLVNYIDGEESGAGGAGNSDEGKQEPGENGGADGGEQNGNGGESQEPEKKGDTPEAKFKRWKISKAKKEAVKQVIGNEGGSGEESGKTEYTDSEIETMLEKMLEEKLAGRNAVDPDISEKLSKIDKFEEKLERDDFFNQFKEAGKDFEKYGLSIDPQKGGEILADIETNGFTPNQLILLQNADEIMEKLKTLPKAPTSTNNGQKPNIDRSKMTMSERIAAIKNKLGV